MLDFRCRHRYPSGFELDLSFRTNGNVTALFGPSGSGKSTILALIAGLLRPREGEIRLANEVLLDTGRSVDVPPERRGIGFVFQDHLLFPHLTVAQNLRFGMRRRARRKIDFGGVIEILELEPFLQRYPPTLSGGQRQRVALGRAILCGPNLLLMDEPLSSLDDALKERIVSYLERVVHEFQIPALYVSHDGSTASRLATQIVCLRDGKVVNDHSPPTACSTSHPPSPIGPAQTAQ